MIGRCYEYEYVKHSLDLTDGMPVKYCDNLYEIFVSAAGFKPVCKLDMSTYEAFFRQAHHGAHIINRAIFWSGTYDVAHGYAAQGKHFITLEDTLGAYMANGLKWCGKFPSRSPFDYDSCPQKCDDDQWSDAAFWSTASAQFAAHAAGEIFVVLNGTRTSGAFTNTSYFTLYELPNLTQRGPYRVTKVNVLLLHGPDLPIYEKCGEKSLITLEKAVISLGFKYTCTDDPDELLLIMCGLDWQARECQIARKVLHDAWQKKLNSIPRLLDQVG
ncbi:unnamed protein product [Didymodactylos carnosus]|uniref:ADP-ribosyl cyclase/cyclic ADP-ribose hydrolase n=1 Tax=Didymodactylos carnosus TaxID=1234261 RepID=A0A814TKA1_9BILA|nr:unnamed protein product [Didymodactylos carnosus]CAF1162530.1 unnamed protein product [Didymodactylos carnosus]CAF3740231.1 unnamed protein product [Didymodactylos carnosus]CAF3926063.1 unnamed protein product [Didymodactylos carnosus]